jgi:hypothetical protein
MAQRFNNERLSADLTERQEWLYDSLISELEHRRRNAKPGWTACSCYLCTDPFDPAVSDAAYDAG